MFGDPVRGKVRYQRVLPIDLYADELDAQLGDPRMVCQIHSIDRRALMHSWLCRDAEGNPDAAKMAHVEQLQSIEYDVTGIGGNYAPTIADRVRLYEWYHLPSVPPRDHEGEIVEGHDGRHVFAVKELALHDEPWHREYFPYVREHYVTPFVGWDGRGIPARGVGLQLEVNKLLRRAQDQLHKLNNPTIILDRAWKVHRQHLTNGVGNIVQTNGGKPIIDAPRLATVDQLFESAALLKDWFFEQEGISQLSASAAKPKGVDAAVALQMLQDVEAIRFTPQNRAYEEAHVELARQTLDCARELDETLQAQGRSFSARFVGNQEMREVKWSEVAKLGPHVVKVWPTSLLPATPAAKSSRISDWIDKQMFSVSEGRRMLLEESPDLEDYSELVSSPITTLRKVLSGIEHHGRGRWVEPKPYWPLELARDLCLEHLMRAETFERPTPHLDDLRDYLVAIDEQIKESGRGCSAHPLAPARRRRTHGRPPGTPRPPPDGAHTGARLGLCSR